MKGPDVDRSVKTDRAKNQDGKRALGRRSESLLKRQKSRVQVEEVVGGRFYLCYPLGMVGRDGGARQWRRAHLACRGCHHFRVRQQRVLDYY